jgi:tetratricopeptide (TPR) repeat protein
MPLPYPHRATFLASTLIVPAEQTAATPFLARLFSLLLFDHFLRHPIVTLGDDDDQLSDDENRLLDASHPAIEDSIDWMFRIARRHEVLWFEVSLDRARPQATLLRSRTPNGAIEEWTSSPDLALSQQLGQCITQWLATRRLPIVPQLSNFTLDDMRTAGERLTKAHAVLSQRTDYTQIPQALITDALTPPLPRLAIPYLRVLAGLSGAAARTLDAKILELDPTHPVARRNAYVTSLLRGGADRRDILPLITEAPMYGKPHLSIWGEPFAADRPYENMGVRHQGIAASLMPANPYACHNFSLQLADEGRKEESYRWADRATVASPYFGAAHLDCVRRLRQVGRPGQAFAEAQYRCREILERAAAGKLPPNDWQAPHHAALLIAFAHLDVGRIAEAIELADDAIARLPPDPPIQEAFTWATKRISHWKTDAGLLARAYAWEGYHRGDPGRAISGLARGRLTDEDDCQMLIESLISIGREDQAQVAYHHCAGLDGAGLLGDAKARLASAKALILAGDLEEALDQIQITQLRRSQSRLEAEVNRLWRLAATRSHTEWDRVIERRLERGATRLAQMAARDIADFVPGTDTHHIRRALGDRKKLKLESKWLADLINAVRGGSQGDAIVSRLARPADDSLKSADALAQEWWTVLVPPAKDREAHGAGAVLALGISLARYLVETSGPPTPIAGAYRHIATEALNLVRRSRYQIDPNAIAALLRLLDRMSAAPEWLLDTWLLRVERALDLEAEHGAYLEGMLAGMPAVQRLLRGDERIGWELRLAHDLASDPSQYEPAAMLFERCVRAVEAGGTALAWSTAAVAGAPLTAQLDVHWIAALANPSGVAEPWLRVASGLLSSGRANEGFAAACYGMTASNAKDRPGSIAVLTPAWKAAAITTPISGDGAFEAGLTAAAEQRLDAAVQHLRWAAAIEPGNAKRAQSLAVALARAGNAHEAIRVLAAHDRTDAALLIGRVLVEAGRDVDAVAVLRYASRRFRSAEDWSLLANAANRADNEAVTVDAGRRAILLGAKDSETMMSLATGLYRMGEFVECEKIAQQLISERGLPRDVRIVGLHAMARALAGQGRHVEAHTYAKEAARLGPNGELAAELIETMDRIVAQQTPPIRASGEGSMDRTAWADLEAGKFDALIPAISSPSWSITRAALAACEFRKEDESGIPVSPRALEAAVAVLSRTEGTTNVDAVLARIRALRIRDNAFIQIDAPPPLGVRYTTEDFERAYLERDKRPHRPSAIFSAVR